MIELVRCIAERVTQSRGLEVVDVEFGRGRGSHFVRVLVDRAGGGVGLADLQSVSEEISTIMDADDPIDSSYRLEVSSPGLDRPLRTEADFRRCVGRHVSVRSREPIEGQTSIKGCVESVVAGAVRIRCASREEATIDLPLASLDHARLEVDFAHGSSKRPKRRERNWR